MKKDEMAFSLMFTGIGALGATTLFYLVGLAGIAPMSVLHTVGVIVGSVYALMNFLLALARVRLVQEAEQHDLVENAKRILKERPHDH